MTTPVFKTRKICAGNYAVSNGSREVEVFSAEFSDGLGWIARANWDRHLYTDPLATKRDAVAAAREMLTQGAE